MGRGVESGAYNSKSDTDKSANTAHNRIPICSQPAAKGRSGAAFFIRAAGSAVLWFFRKRRGILVVAQSFVPEYVDPWKQAS